MKNLELFDISRKCINENAENTIQVLVHEDILYILKEYVLIIRYPTSDQETEIFNDKFTNVITPLVILEIEQQLWFATGREVVYIDLHNHSVKVINFEFDFVAAEWSPTQDSLAVVSSNGDIGLYYIDINLEKVVLIEKCNLQETFDSKLISVGWGSVSTQFVGKNRKHQIQDTEETAEIQDIKPHISWRGNGEMFVVNYFSSGKRVFKTFEHPCQFLYQSEETLGLQSLISWRPEGNLIATIVNKSKNLYVNFFEKTGLFRNEFRLHDQKPVEQIKWSDNGECLAVLQNDEITQSLNLYLMKNYVWYLKQQLTFQRENLVLNYEFLNSSFGTYKLRVNTSKESLTYVFRTTLHINTASESIPLICAVINGTQVYLTQCKEGVTPPPMHNGILHLESPANFIVFHPLLPTIVVIDSHNFIYVFDYYNLQTRLITKTNLLEGEDPLIPIEQRSFSWRADGHFYYVQGKEKSNIMRITFNGNETNWDTKLAYESENTINILEKVRGSTDIVEQHRHEIIIKDNEDIKYAITLKLPAIHIKSVKIGNSYFILSLTESGLFFINDIEVFNNIVSFIIHDNYLFLTSTLSKLIGLRLDHTLNKICEQKMDYLYSRAIEQGGSLLFGIPNTSYLVMQLPRGNLEIITCKMMSIDRLVNLTINNHWKEALDIVRMEKLCTSILIDLNVNHFISQSKNFVLCLKSCAILDDFILGLQEECVFTNLYKHSGSKSCNVFEDKVEKVCSALIEAMEDINYVYYCKTIVICCIIANGKDCVKQALGHIRNLLHMVEKQKVEMRQVEDALQVLITLKPKSDLYNISLELYDLDLTLFVARNCQMDPNEFQPFIHDLKSSDPLTCRFKINHHLQKYSIALAYLMRSVTDKSTILSYIEQYSLYKEAYSTIGIDSDLFPTISQMYGRQLSRKGLHEESACVYARAGFYKESLEEYIQSLNWMEVVGLLEKIECKKVDKNAYLIRLCDALKRHNKPKEASAIYAQYLNDEENAIDVAIEGKCFATAYGLIQKYKRNDIMDLKLIPSLTAFSMQLNDKFKNMYETFVKYKKRLSVVRSKNTVVTDRDVDLQESTVEDDIYSLADSTISEMSRKSSSSRYSSMSSRNRRKEERKKCDLREGGVYEDIALIRALYELYKKAFQYGTDVREITLLQMKIHQTLPHYVEEMHNTLLRLHLLMKNSTSEIWPETLNETNVENNAIQQNINLLDLKYRYPPDELNTNWKISTLEIM